MTSQDQ